MAKCMNCDSEAIKKIDDKHVYCPDCKTSFVITKDGETAVDYDVPKRIEAMEKKIDVMYADHIAKKEGTKNGENKADDSSDPYAY
jgi:uncharacterized Zn finger protein (UPF0148 family)